MSILRKLLYPFSILYGEVTSGRNVLYNKKILKSSTFEIPTIVVGNLSVGGTGKTPQIEYLARLLQSRYKTAILSRGYKRSTKGFVLANENSTVEEIGDEPLQYFKKFKDVLVAVDAERVHGIQQLVKHDAKPEIILLDDAFQHRKVDAGLNILLTPYDDLYVDDVMLPTGNLREKVSGAQRAQIIVVTKCPDKISEENQFEISKKLKVELEQTLFFSKINYASHTKGSKRISLDDLQNYKVLLITGIAKTKPLEDYLSKHQIDFKHIKFKDHHAFTSGDYANIRSNFENLNGENKMILTTEKDYVRGLDQLKDVSYLPIETKFIDHQKDFDELILTYISRDRIRQNES